MHTLYRHSYTYIANTYPSSRWSTDSFINANSTKASSVANAENFILSAAAAEIQRRYSYNMKPPAYLYVIIGKPYDFLFGKSL